MNALKKFNLTDDELADFVNRLTKLMKKRGGTFLILGLILCTSLRG
ncbi:hypothetical protein [Nitrososphaera viennensis]|uniref:Uncharacterized protein n=1 Tax=Nitrososphaera viennensis TaxID=1034015 RepID=A0A977IE74_9ARCH|nr:hypothetical protein [Nitrososphaera viennensis]UVS69146.1 hypothetical protein NWT39_14745 [Nitrososphaera viennensis]